MKKKSILISSPIYHVSGITTHVLNLSKILSTNNYEVTLVGPSTLSTSLSKDLKKIGVNLCTVPFSLRTPYRDILKFILLVKSHLKFKKNSFDIIYSNGWGNFHSYFKPFLKQEGKFIFHQHNQHNKVGFSRFRKTINIADVIIVNSESIAKDTSDSLNENKCLHVLPPLHGLATPPHPSDYFPFIKHGYLKVGYIGRFEYEKGVMRLLEAWESANLSSAKLLFYGDGSLKSEIINMINKKKLDNVSIEGRFDRDEIGTIMRKLDFIVLLSDSESTGLPIIEGLAYGVPSVTTRIGEIEELANEIEGINVVEPTVTDCKRGIINLSRAIREEKIDRRSLYKYFCENWSSELLEKLWLDAMNSYTSDKLN